MPEREMDLEQCETEEREQVNLRILSGFMAKREKKVNNREKQARSRPICSQIC